VSSFLTLASLLIMLLSALVPPAPVQARPGTSPQGQPPTAPADQTTALTQPAAVTAVAFTPAPDDINVAVGKVATQTDENALVADPYPGGLARHAIDGATNGLYSNGSVTQTWGNKHDALDWWEVDLVGIYPIGTVQIWNRTDCCTERLHDFYVVVSDTPFVSNDLNVLKTQAGVSAFFTAGLATVATAIPVNRTGRYVRVILTEPGSLSLAEVQVWSKRSTRLDRPTNLPIVAATPQSQAVKLNWPPVRDATSYTVKRATTRGGPYTTIASSVTSTVLVGARPMLQYTDSARVNGTAYYYVVTAMAAGVVRGVSPEVQATPGATFSHTGLAPLPASQYNAMSGITTVTDATLGRPVVTSGDVGDYVMFRNVNFGAGVNGVRIKYKSQSPYAGNIIFSTLPSDDGLIASVPITNTGFLPVWSSSSELVKLTSGVKDLYVGFTGLGDNLADLDQIQFFAPGPYDTATVKWDPDLVLLHKSMGITLASYSVSTDRQTVAMTFSASTAQGQAALASVKVGSMIASDTNLDLGGPYGRAMQVTSLNAASVAVAMRYLPFNKMIFGGGYDASAAIQNAFTQATQALVGTSALGPGYTTAGYDSRMPTVTYYGDEGALTSAAGSPSSRVDGLGAPQATGSAAPAMPAPKEAKGAPLGRFHVTMDNAQFITDEDGFGVELVNLRMNALGIQPGDGITTPNPVATQFGFGVLGGVGFDTLRFQARLKINNGTLTPNKTFDIGISATAKAHAQLKGLAVGLWFFETPDDWLKSIPFAIPTPIGPLPSAAVLGIQGYVIGVGLGNLTAEFGGQLTFTSDWDPRKWLRVAEFGERKMDIGQRVDNVSLIGLALEPFVKVRIGTFGKVADDVLDWIALRMGETASRLKQLQGVAVFTFTPRLQVLHLLQNWKDKDRPIYRQKICVQPVAKAEAMPGFPIKMTFELRIEGNPYCLYNKGWLYYDVKVPPTVQADPATRQATVKWETPIISERSDIPILIDWHGPYPMSMGESSPVVESTAISDAFFNAATRRFCVIYRRPFTIADSVAVIWQGPCQAQGSTQITLPQGQTYANYTLRVMTEYRIDLPVSLASAIGCDAQGLPCGTSGVWSEKNFSISSAEDSTTFTVNGTEVFTDSATQLAAIKSAVCDPEGKVAKDMLLKIAIAPPPNTNWVINSAEMEVDGLKLAATITNSSSQPGQKILNKTQNLAAGPHTLKVIAQLSIPNYDYLKRTATYYATFKAQPKPCDRAKPDAFSATIYESGPCDNQTTPFQPLPVLGNDDATGTTGLKVVAVSGASLGAVQIAPDGQTLRYKPSAPGLDTFTYTIGNAETPPSNGVVIQPSTASVLVTNRKADPNDCPDPGGPGGPGAPGSPGGPGRFGAWGDPHITTADGQRFDSHALGEFVYLRPKTGQTGLTIQGRQDYYVQGAGVAVMKAIAVKINGRVLEFYTNRAPAVLVDGESTSSTMIDLGGAASLTIGGSLYQIQAGATRIEIVNKGSYLDLDITLTRDGTLEGLLGTPNGNPNDDLQLPNGTPITGTTVNDMMTLSDGWRITDRAKSLFTYGPGEGPETFNKANLYLGQLPTGTQLAPYVQQAEDLLTNTCAAAGAPANAREAQDLALELYLGAQPATVASQLCSYEITGALTTANPAGAPAVGTLVTLTSAQTQSCQVYTNSLGQYRCTLAPLPGAAAPTVQVTTAGLPPQTVTFAMRAPIHGTLSQTLNLVVTRPTVRLTVRSFNDANTLAPGAVVEVQSIGVTRQVTMGANGAATLVLSYEPGTTTAWFTGMALAPAYSYTASASVTLSQSGPVDATLDVKHYVLGTPAWVRSSTPETSDQFDPIISDSTPAVGADGTIYTIGYQYEPTADGYRLVATNPDGTPKWVASRTFAADYKVSPSIGPDGTIYVLNWDYPNRSLLAFNTDGSVKWTFALPKDYYYTSHTPAIGADGRIYFVGAAYPAATTRLYAINPATGAAVWTVALNDSYTESSPVIAADGTIYVLGSRLRRFSASGTLLGASTALTMPQATLALGLDGAIYVSDGGNSESSGPFMQAFNPDLTLRWQQYKGSQFSTVIGPDGGVYVKDYNQLTKLNPTTGATLWSAPITVDQAPVIGADGSIYVATRTSISNLPWITNIVRLSASGAELSRFKVRVSYGYGLVMGPGGTIYMSATSASNSSGYDLVAIPTASSGPATSWSSMFGNARNTNRRTP
jgi:hypothetical protein